MPKEIISFRTRPQAQHAARLASHYFPNPENAYLALLELMLNAVEHGNLEIGAATKLTLLKAGTWEEEIAARLARPPYGARVAQAEIVRQDNRLRILIRDEGKGFDWRPYMREDLPDPAKAAKPRARGIWLARHLGLDLEYHSPGNRVLCTPAIAAQITPSGARLAHLS